MHLLVIIIAAILIVLFFLNNPGILGKFVGGFLLAIGILVVFVAIGSVLPDTQTPQQQTSSVTISNSEIQKQADVNVNKMLFDFDQRKMNYDQKKKNFDHRYQ